MTANQFEIKIRVEDESELYNSFDPTETTLSDDLTNYICHAVKNQNRGEKTLLHIISKSAINEEKFKKALDSYFVELQHNYQKQKKTNRINALRMSLIGVLFILLGIVLHGKFCAVTTTVVETFGSFSIWEAANIWLEEMPKLRLIQRIIVYLGEPEIKCEVVNEK